MSRNRRRQFLITTGAFFAAPLVAAQQAGKVFRVALLAGGGRTPDGAPPAPLREAMLALGYADGRNVVYVTRFAEAKLERLPDMAAELVGLKIDAIVALGGPAALAAKRATSTIPIITALAAGDNVAAGLIASLARPGGNVTGLTDESVPLSAKRMELLKQAVPKAALIAVLWNENDQGMTLRYQEIEKAARILKIEVQPLGVRAPDDFTGAFSAMASRRPDAMFLVADALTTMNRKQLIEFAAANGIPAMFETSANVRDGGLMSYGPDAGESYRRAASYLDRIFKGAKPADLPSEHPMRYYLTVNLKTAKALGLPIPPSIMIRADHVVE